ncbi:hypothetical protein KC727_02825 [Candidatus Kaiserbacteria bacterium]|nr:hypothetical protein [Candidatus Kaiserbacteria bacterium]
MSFEQQLKEVAKNADAAARSKKWVKERGAAWVGVGLAILLVTFVAFKLPLGVQRGSVPADIHSGTEEGYIRPYTQTGPFRVTVGRPFTVEKKGFCYPDSRSNDRLKDVKVDQVIMENGKQGLRYTLIRGEPVSLTTTFYNPSPGLGCRETLERAIAAGQFR